MSDWVIEAEDLTKVYLMGEVEVHALRGLSVQIERGEMVSIMGPSGSGKSTLMNIIGCLDRPTAGEYILDGERVSELNDDQLASIRNRKVGFVFQTFNLLPRATALANVELPMRYSGSGRGGRALAKAALEAVGLEDRIRHRPNELSGGQQQRVGVARALAGEASILLMDEPFGALDPVTRDDLQQQLVEMRGRLGLSIVLVTHDVTEALLLADRVAVMDAGRILQIGRPEELFAAPADEHVALLLDTPCRQSRRLQEIAMGSPAPKAGTE